MDARLTEIERKHNLDAKNSALLRSMAVKRFTKHKKSSAHNQEPRTKVTYFITHRVFTHVFY